MKFAVIALIVICVIISFVISIYNTLVKLKTQLDNAWSQISVQLKRRHDLIPNLVETVKGYAAHEQETFDKVIKARQQAIDISSGSAKDVSGAENELSSALKSIFALAEAYPDLKANQNFLSLQEELASMENKIAYARQFYNDSAMHYNEAVQIFPNCIFAGMFNFHKADYFEIDQAESEVVKVSF